METSRTAEARVMRGIEAREHRKAVAERRAAQAAHRAAAASPPSRVGWSTKATKAERLRDKAAAKMTKIRLARATDEDKRLRAELAAAAKRWDHKRHATPATLKHATRRGSLAGLYHSGAIDAVQLASAADIAGIAERIGADVGIRTASFETRLDGGRRSGSAFWEALGAVRREIAYTAWRAELGGAAAIVLDMIVGDGEGYSVVARRWRMHPRRGKALLLDALDRWPRLIGEACKAIDSASLDQAHACLLG